MSLFSKPRLAAFLGPVAAAVAIHVVLLALQVHKHSGDPAILVGASVAGAGQPPYEHLTVSLGVLGYDGQYYYAVARNPWVRRDAGIDWPSARRLRILYPALCWVCSLGDARWLVWIMPAVNLVGIGALAFLGARFAAFHGRSPWWGLALPLALNVALPALRDLTDCLSTLALCGLLMCWLLRSAGITTVLWAAVAVFSREQNIAVVALLLAAAVLSGRYGMAAGMVCVLAAWGAWVVYLRLTYGVWPFLPSEGNFTSWPLAGWLSAWRSLDASHGRARQVMFNATSLLQWSLLLAAAVWLAVCVRSRLLAAFLTLAVLLAVMAGPAIYVEVWSYRRVLVWAPLGLWLAAFRLRLTWPLWLLSVAPVWSLAAALGRT
jgi:hypothetical protein